jgi:putative intracellular protease/amidase
MQVSNGKYILMIVTSNAKMGDSAKPTGIWIEELAVPYYQFVDAGLDVTIASPLGGAVPFDPSSMADEGKNSPQVERFLADADAQKRVKNTATVASVETAEFDAVFLPGGHGTMWDLPNDPSVKKVIEAQFGANKIVAAVCHGPAGLVSAKRSDGKSILFRKRVSAFTDAEEVAAGLMDVVPFTLEARVKELGGLFEGVANWQPHAVRDGNLITGQNPKSSEKVASLVLDALNEKGDKSLLAAE